MILDIRTTVFLLLVSAALMAMVLFQGTRGRRGNGLRQWLFGLLSTTTAWMLIALRARVDPLLSVVLADAIMLCGLCLFIAGLRAFEERPPARWLALPAPLLFVFLVPFRHDFPAYTLIASVALAAALAALARMSWRAARPGTRAVLASVFILCAVMLIIRAVDIQLSTGTEPTLFDRDIFQGGTFVALFAMTITGTFGFLEMHRGRAEDALRHLAMFDGLTEMLNRRAFLEIARREMRRARRGVSPIAVLMIDIDHFKRVNDTFGHAVGDETLAAIASVIRARLRDEDSLGRLGGEEFCVVLPDRAVEESVAIAERIRSAVSACEIPNVSWSVTVSIGVAACQPGSDDALESLIRQADEALLAAKRAGRNRVLAAPPPAAGREMPSYPP